jgi:hypothetical protein
MIVAFRCKSGFDSTAKGVISAPVPAFVGTAISGRPRRSGTRTSASRRVVKSQHRPPLVTASDTALAASIVEPPPIAMIIVAPCTTASAAARSQVAARGFGTMSCHSRTPIPAPARSRSTRASSAEAFRNGSSMTKARAP